MVNFPETVECCFHAIHLPFLFFIIAAEGRFVNQDPSTPTDAHILQKIYNYYFSNARKYIRIGTSIKPFP